VPVALVAQSVLVKSPTLVVRVPLPHRTVPVAAAVALLAHQVTGSMASSAAAAALMAALVRRLRVSLVVRVRLVKDARQPTKWQSTARVVREVAQQAPEVVTALCNGFGSLPPKNGQAPLVVARLVTSAVRVTVATTVAVAAAAAVQAEKVTPLVKAVTA
jgi:hypothetical protein